MYTTLKEMGSLIRRSFLHFCFPSCCLSCQELMDDPDHLFCSTCSLLLELIDPLSCCAICFCEMEGVHHKAICIDCRMQKKAITRAAAAFDYIGPVTCLIKRLKYGGSTYLASSCAYFLAMQYVQLDWKRFDYLIPVPMPSLRRFLRGFNQSQLIAKELGKILGVPVLTALGRKGGALRQAQLSLEERRLLSTEQFFLKADRLLLEDKRLLIIDDVWTTGSTLDCCAEVLREAYPSSIYALTVCRTVKECSKKRECY